MSETTDQTTGAPRECTLYQCDQVESCRGPEIACCVADRQQRRGCHVLATYLRTDDLPQDVSEVAERLRRYFGNPSDADLLLATAARAQAAEDLLYPWGRDEITAIDSLKHQLDDERKRADSAEERENALHAEMLERTSLEARRAWMLYALDVETPCPRCGGTGKRCYPDTSTWGSGMGGQMITTDVCDVCWGTGDATHKGADLRALTGRIRAAEAEVARLREAAITTWQDQDGQWRADCYLCADLSRTSTGETADEARAAFEHCEECPLHQPAQTEGETEVEP